MEVSREILSDIADSLEAGLKCFIHRDTHEVISFPKDYEDQLFDGEEDPWDDEKKKIKNAKRKYFEVQSMPSRFGFKVMEEFVHSINNNPTKNLLLKALEGRKPFANFKDQIDSLGNYREQWFKFRREKNIQWLQKQLDFKQF